METKERKQRFETRKLVFAAVSIALATVISVAVKLPSLPNGGSVTLFSMLMITMIGYWYGPGFGIISGIVYGILQFITGPYVVHPLQVILDYPLAFGALGLSGFFHDRKNGLIIGYITGVFGRFFWACISGIIFYTEYVGNLQGNMLAVWGSILYNLTYLLPEAVMTIVVLLVPAVRKALSHIKGLALE